MDIFNTLAFITKLDPVELPEEAKLEEIETVTEAFDLQNIHNWAFIVTMKLYVNKAEVI